MTKELAAIVLSLSLLAASQAEYISAKRKMDLIDSDRLRSGSRVVFTPAELAAFAQQEAPDGVRDTRLVLGKGVAYGSALIDFGKVRRAQGHPPGWLASKLLDGERPVRVAARIESARGTATVTVESVQVSGLTVDGRMLDFLISQVLLPNYPDAKVGRPFELAHGVDRLEVKPSQVDVVIGAR